MNPSTGGSWKYLPDWTKAEKNLIKFVQDNSYTASDIFVAQENREATFRIKTFYTNKHIPFSHAVTVEPGVITPEISSTFRLNLNNTLSYYIIMTDPKLSINNARLDTVPRIIFRKNNGTEPPTFLYLKVYKL